LLTKKVLIKSAELKTTGAFTHLVPWTLAATGGIDNVQQLKKPEFVFRRLAKFLGPQAV
jgi:hypothetical protein